MFGRNLEVIPVCGCWLHRQRHMWVVCCLRLVSYCPVIVSLHDVLMFFFAPSSCDTSLDMRPALFNGSLRYPNRITGVVRAAASELSYLSAPSRKLLFFHFLFHLFLYTFTSYSFFFFSIRVFSYRFFGRQVYSWKLLKTDSKVH